MDNTVRVYSPELDIFDKYDDFSSLSISELSGIRKIAGIINIKKGRSPFKVAGRNNLFYFVSGELEIKTSERSYCINNQTDMELLRKAFNEQGDVLSAVATRHSSVLFIDKNKFYDLLALASKGSYVVEDLTDVDAVNENADWMQLMLTTKLFQRIPPQNIQKLFFSFKSKTIARGIRVISEGEGGDQFYVIKKGRAVVSRKGVMGEDIEMVTLKEGDYFGEEALVGETTRNATVTMRCDGEIMCLDKNAFQQLLQAPVLQDVSTCNVKQWSDEEQAMVVIDVRLPIEFRQDKKEGRINIPLSDLRNQIPSLHEDVRYVVACDDGCRSKLGAYLLNEAGLDAYVLAS